MLAGCGCELRRSDRLLVGERKPAYALLRSILREAEDEALIERNPCRIRNAGQVRRTRDIEPASPAEPNRLLDLPRGTVCRYSWRAGWTAGRGGSRAPSPRPRPRRRRRARPGGGHKDQHRPHGNEGIAKPEALMHDFTGGGMSRNDHTSSLNAFKKHASCNSRAISPSQKHFGVPHNPWVVFSSPTRPPAVYRALTRHFSRFARQSPSRRAFRAGGRIGPLPFGSG